MITIKVLLVPFINLMILKLTIAIGIESFEDLHKFLMFLVPKAHIVGKVREDSLLQLLFDVYCMHVFDDVLHHRLLKLVGDMLLRNSCILKDPLIIQSFLCADSFIRLVG